MTLTNNAEVTWLSRHSDFATCIDADQTEIAAIRFSSAPVQEGMRDDKRSGAIADSLKATNTPTERAFALSTKLEEAGGAIAEELRRRALLLGPAYPFKLVRGTLRHKPTVNRVYEFCLCASISDSLSKKPYNELPIAFERLCCTVSRSLFGPRAMSVRTGWPRSQVRDGMPIRAKKLFSKIHEMTGEWKWEPDDDLPDDPDPKYFKEKGLDLLTWIPMPDGRIGSLFLLGQCACGRTDWFDKRHEPDIGMLRRWFKPMTVAEHPIKCLFVPFHVSNTSDLKDITNKAYMLDRARITLISANESTPWQRKFHKETDTLIQHVVSSGINRKKK